MDKLNELQSQAVKEGISVGAEETATPETSNNAASAESAPASQTQTPTQASSPAKTSMESAEVPFHKHPRFQEVLRKNKEYEQQVSELRAAQKAQEAYLQQMRSLQSPQTGIPDEQRQAILQLAKLFKQVPEFQQELGLNQIEELKKQNEQLMTQRSEEAFNKEFDETLSYAKSLGMDADDVMQELNDAIQRHPIYSQAQFKPGMVRAVFRDHYWDRMGELKKREVNSELIKEQERKRASNSETSSANTTVPKKKLEPSIEQFLSRRIQEEGGIVI